MKEQETRNPSQPYHADFNTYLSPFTYRYGSEEMRSIWSQEHYWSLAQNVWIAVAKTQKKAGIITQSQVDDLIQHRNQIFVERILTLEKETGHDVAGAIAAYSEVAPEGGTIIHQGMTSEDVLSNVEIMQIHESLELVRTRLVTILDAFGKRIDENKDLICMGWTHLQAAEPITIGHRFANYAQDLLIDLQLLDTIKPMIKGKGVKGAVGTSASFTALLQGTGMSSQEHEKQIMEQLGIEPVSISTQTYPRKFLTLTENIIVGIGQTLHRFAFDIQLLQSSPIGELSEPRKKGQVGSSAMPHKQNPIISENIDSLTEELPSHQTTSWITGAFVNLERTLRDSAGKRSWLPESFLIIDESLIKAEKIVRGLTIHKNAVKTNLARFAPFCVAEIILGKLVQKGLDRKKAHELLVTYCEQSDDAIRSGLDNPMKKLLLGDAQITAHITPQEIEDAFIEIFHHVGDASKRCIDFLQKELYPAIM